MDPWFLSAPLYLFETFFVGKATEHLIGEGVTPDQLNDDRIGRALDKYYQAGTTKLFTTIALRAADKFQIKMNSVHLDSRSISVEGEYKSRESENQEVEAESSDISEEMKAIKIVHGYSRDRRPDLKQFIIDTIVSGDGDVPLYLKIIESETRKQATIKKIDKQVEKQLENALASLRKLSKQEFACIADAEIAIKMLSDSWKYHQIKEIKCQEKASQKPTDKT